MFLVAPDGRLLEDAVRERVAWLCGVKGYLDDEELLLNAVLSDPEIASLLETILDDESGKTVFDAVVDDICRQVADELRRRHVMQAS